MMNKESRLGLVTFVITLSLLLGTIVCSIHAAMPGNILMAKTSFGAALQTALIRVMPQGWNFFTNPPQDPTITIYMQGPNGEFQDASMFPQTKLENAFGITREQRAQGPELATLFNDPNLEWIDCEPTKSDSCFLLAQDSSASLITNISRWKSVCGEAFIAVEKPVPFLYRHSYEFETIILRIAKANVSCNQ